MQNQTICRFILLAPEFCLGPYHRDIMFFFTLLLAGVTGARDPCYTMHSTQSDIPAYVEER